MRPGASELVVIAGSAEPLDVPDAPPVVVPVALFEAEPEADPVADAVSSCEDPAAELAAADPPLVGDALELEPGSLGRPCEATLETKRSTVRSRGNREISDCSESRMATDCIRFSLVKTSGNLRATSRLSISP